ETNDLDGPGTIRQMMFEALAARGVQLMPLAEIDAKLKEHGFTEGGQLKATTPQKIGEWLQADGLLYGTLEDFNYITLGFYSEGTVKISGKVMDAGTGERLWEAEGGYSSRIVVADKKAAERQLAIQLAAKMVEKATHYPLRFESLQAVHRLLMSLP